MSKLDKITPESIKSASESTLKEWFQDISDWSQTAINSKAFQEQLSTSLENKILSDANTLVGKYSSLAHRIRTRLIYEFELPSYAVKKL